MVMSSSHSDYSEKSASGVDTNVNNTVTDSLYINGNRSIGVYVDDGSGAHTSHIVTIQVSANETDWHDTALTVTGLGFKEGETTAQYIRAKVTTAEGGASTSDIHLTSK